MKKIVSFFALTFISIISFGQTNDNCDAISISVSAIPSSISEGVSSTIKVSGCQGGTTFNVVDWQDNPRVNVPNNGSIRVVTQPGTYSFKCYTSRCVNGRGAFSITVGKATCSYTTPTLTANPTVIAAGQSSTLTATGCSGGIITWKDGTTGFTKVVNAGGIYSATCTESGCLPSASSSVTVGQCDLTSPKSIGTKFGNQVLIMKWGNAIAITEVVEEAGQTRFYPRGKDFYNFWMDKYHHSDELYTCVNTSVSAGNGMAMPPEVSNSQAGYTLGTKPDGAKYFVANSPDPCSFWVEKHIAKQNGRDVVIKNFGGIKSIATINNMDGRKAYFPRGVNFLTDGLSNTDLNIQLDANFNASILGCLNGEQTAWWGLAPIQALSESATLPNGFQNGYGMINGELHWYIYSPTGARMGVKENVSPQPMALKATPNPAENQMKATYTLQNDQNVWFSIIDNQGKSKLMENVQGKKGINTKTFELSNFTKGIYFLNLQSGSQKETIKVIKK